MDYNRSIKEIRKIIHKDPGNACRSVVDFLHDNFSKYSWVGIYLVKNEEIILGPWKGPQATEHVRIPIGNGVCGSAVASGVTEIVDDVNADPRYLSCFISTKSEIVVPIKKNNVVFGEIDIDSDESAAFDKQDADFLENVAVILGNVL